MENESLYVLKLLNLWYCQCLQWPCCVEGERGREDPLGNDSDGDQGEIKRDPRVVEAPPRVREKPHQQLQQIDREEEVLQILHHNTAVLSPVGSVDIGITTHF